MVGLEFCGGGGVAEEGFDVDVWEVGGEGCEDCAAYEAGGAGEEDCWWSGHCEVSAGAG